MASDTIITLVGNRRRIPERFTGASGAAVVPTSVASTRTFDRQANEWKDGETALVPQRLASVRRECSGSPRRREHASSSRVA